ncbi:MAG: putative DNA binding domain-containing protein [Rikenellaceae bacterium]
MKINNIKQIIHQPEGRRLEFKEQLSANSDIAKTVVAFANDAGGDIFFGVADEPRAIVGLDSDSLMELEEQVSSIIYDRCYPAILPEIKFVSVDDKQLMQVSIFRGSTPPYYIKEQGKHNGTYIRVGSTNRKADIDIISELERKRRNISFDSEVVLEKSVANLNISGLKSIYEEKTGEPFNNQVLRKLDLVKEEQGVEYPTNALLLLSDDSLRNTFFHFAKVECARFKGTTSDVFIDRKSITTNIVLQAEEAFKFVLRNINEGATVKGVYTVGRWEYPIKAIREVLRNSVVHRDYSITGSDIKVAIYDDMVEVTSPGLLYPSIDFNAMESRQSYARNKLIAPLFKHLGIIDQWGNGLKLVADEMKNYPNIELKWREVGLSFQVQFVKCDYTQIENGGVNSENGGVNGDNVGVNDANVGVNCAEGGVNGDNGGVNGDNGGVNRVNGGVNGGVKEQILELIKDNEGINTKAITTLLPDTAIRTVERYIKELRDKDIIEFRGAPKTGGYYIK